MSARPLTRYDHPAAWTAKELMAQSDKWVYQLTGEDLAELDAALQQIKSKGLIVPYFGKDDFPMPKLAARLEEPVRELEFGIGILNITGFPVEKYTKDETSAIFWGIGSYIGPPWAQNAAGHVLGDIRDQGRNLEDTSARGYQTNADLDLHTDGADIVGLLCLNQAKEGGENQLVSAIAAFNKLIEIDPDAAEHLLNTTFYLDWRGEEGPGEKPYYALKLFTETPKGMTSLAIIPYVHSAQRFEEVPRLTEQDLAALESFERAKWDEPLVLRVLQEPGCMLFLNNHYLMHARSEFTDFDDSREKRHLRRLWLESEAWADARPPAMATILKKVREQWDTGVGVEMWDQT